MVLDTNILIAFFDGEPVVVDWFQKQKIGYNQFFIPTMVECELLAYKKWTESERMKVRFFLGEIGSSIAMDRYIAWIAAHMRRMHTIKTPDAIIAASALYTGTSLVTRNTRDFKNIKNLSVITI